MFSYIQYVSNFETSMITVKSKHVNFQPIIYNFSNSHRVNRSSVAGMNRNADVLKVQASANIYERPTCFKDHSNVTPAREEGLN
jgi:hypothetical protein